MDTYAAIVVGARCAGAPTAMLLSRAGHRVLLLDRGRFPSDKVMSTHLLHPPGVLRLRQWGLLDEVLANGCPPVAEYGFREGRLDLMAPLVPIDGVAVAYAPRRSTLDAALVRGAVAAGAQLRESASVQELITDGSRVVGVRGTADGVPFAARAPIVIGADGTQSTVARLAGATMHVDRGVLTRGIWTYWADLPVTQLPTFRRNRRYVFAWPTEADLTLVGVAWPTEDFPRGDPETAYLATLAAVAPDFAARVQAARRAEPWRRGSIPNFLRQSYGPGWALVGDAAYSKDPCTAQGMTDAFRDAESLAAALSAGLAGTEPVDRAMRAHEHRRITHSLPFFDYTCDFASLEPYSAEVLDLLVHIDPTMASRLVSLFAQTVSPADFFSPVGIRDLMASVPSPRELSWRMRLAHWLLIERGRRSPRARQLAEFLIRRQLGVLAPHLCGR